MGEIREPGGVNERKGVGTNPLISNHNLYFGTRTLLQRQCLHFFKKILDLEKRNPKSTIYHFLSTNTKKHYM